MKTILIILLLFPFILFGQGAANTRFATPTYLRFGDSTYYVTYYYLSTHGGTATVTIADVIALQDSLDNHTDSLQSHNIRLIAVLDSIARHTDTLQDHNARINAEILARIGGLLLKRDLNNHDSLSTLDEKSYNSLTDKPTIPVGTDYFAKVDSNTNGNAATKKYVDDGLATKAATSHTQAISTITDLQDSITRDYAITKAFNAAGDLIVGSGNNAFSTLTKGSNQQVLKMWSGVVGWHNDSLGGGSSQWTTTGSDIYYNTGNVGIGTTAPFTHLTFYDDYGISLEANSQSTSRRWWLAPNQTESADFAIRTEATKGNSVPGLTRFRIKADGGIVMGTSTAGPYATTITSNVRDLQIDDAGLIGYVTSSRTTKDSIKNMERINWLYKLRPVSFIYKSDTGRWLERTDTTGYTVTPSVIHVPADTVWRDSTYTVGTATGTTTIIVKVVESITPAHDDTTHADTTYQTTIVKVKDPNWKRERMYGLVAEEADSVNPHMVSRDYWIDKEGVKSKIATVNYSRLVVPLLKAVQNHQAEIDTLSDLLTIKTITPLITGITKSQLAKTMYISLTAPLDITGTKQIANGEDAQEIDIIGLSDTNTLKLDNGNNIQMTSSITLGKGDIATFKFVAPIKKWILKSYQNN